MDAYKGNQSLVDMGSMGTSGMDEMACHSAVADPDEPDEAVGTVVAYLAFEAFEELPCSNDFDDFVCSSGSDTWLPSAR